MNIFQVIALTIGTAGAFVAVSMVLWSHNKIEQYRHAGVPPDPHHSTVVRLGLYASLASIALIIFVWGLPFLTSFLSTLSWFY